MLVALFKISMRVRVFLALLFCFLSTYGLAFGKEEDGKRAVYFGANSYGYSVRVERIVNLLKYTEVNAVVVDLKDDNGNVLEGEKFKRVIKPFKDQGAFIICRIVIFRDNHYADSHPELYLKSRTTKKNWEDQSGQSFLDPAHPGTVAYIISLAEMAIENGCEPNFDYIRFPSEGELSDIALPVANDPAKKHPYLRKTMRAFLSALSAGIRAKHPTALFSADLFGYAAMGGEPGIGQYVEDFAEFGFGVYGMFYPSHFRCNAFGIPDPNTDPFRVYWEALNAQLKILKRLGYSDIEVRPWFQGFSKANNYGCGLGVDPKDPKHKRIIGIQGKPGRRIDYADDPARFGQQGRALTAVRNDPRFKEFQMKNSWIVWNPGAYYNPENFIKKK